MASAAADLAERSPAPLTKAAARKVTTGIKRQLADLQARSDTLFDVIAQARADRVWEALEYPDWDAYVQAEFGDLSRGQKHRLAVWAEVVPELEAAAGGPVKVSGRQAGEARKRGAASVADKVREELADKPDPTDEDRRAAVAKALAGPIPATATKVLGPAEVGESLERGMEQAAAGDLVDLGSFQEDEPEEPRARATEAAPARATAGSLIEQLRAIPAEEAAAEIELGQLDALNAWVGITRAAVRRRTASAAPATTATPPAPPPPAKPARKAAAPKGCDVHPVGRIVAGVCLKCGEKAGK